MSLLESLPAEKRAGISRLLQAANEDRSYLNSLQLAKELAGLELAEHVNGSLTVRIALLSSFTIDMLVPYLQLECLRSGIHAEIHVGGYNQFQTLLRNPESDLYAFHPDLVFLAVEPSALVPGLPPIPTTESMIGALDALNDLVTQLKTHSTANLVVHNVPLPDDFIEGVDFTEETAPALDFNLALARAYKDDPQVRILDFSRLAAFHGARHIRDPRLRSLADIEYSETFLPSLARKYASYVRAVKIVSRKCLVVDLDNTLWGGVLGEDGPDGILLSSHGGGRVFHEFQRSILRLHQRGVLLAINSKNDAPAVLEVLKSHPHMVLRPECFASMRINWQDKAHNMREIADELNLGLDSFVFLDDNPVERERVRKNLPEVAVPDLPTDPAEYKGLLESLGLFERLYLTAEDRRRTASYAAAQQRQSRKQESSSEEEFLLSLGTVLTIFRPSEREVARLAQLSQKTNQFNLSTRRYSEADVRGFLADPQWRIYALRVKDRFDDSGLVGLALVCAETEEWVLDTFLLSCRVLGRSVESAFLREILGDALRTQVMRLSGEYIPTPKNGPAKNFLASEGFVAEPSPGPAITWTRTISPEAVEPLPFFTVVRGLSPMPNT
jgi:FkbH-like protein